MSATPRVHESRRRRVRGTRRALALATLLAMVGVAEARVVERIVAVVNKQIVLLSELQQRIAPLRHQLRRIADPQLRRQRLAQLSRQALERMIDQKLIEQQARVLKLKVKDRELKLAIRDVMRKNNLTRAQLVEALRREGKTLTAYKKEILAPELLRMKVLNIKVRPRISVKEDELKALYQKNLRALGVETKVRARHIFFALPAKPTAQQIARTRRRARALLAALKRGADFAKMAKKHSNDSVTRSEGGDLGFFSRGTLPAHVENAVFAMKKGQIGGPFRTDRGFHLIQVTGRKESSARPYKDVRRELRAQLYSQKLEKATRAWLTEVRKRAYVEVRL